MLIDFFIDFETRSRVDLKQCGSVVYATDPSTEATLITWCFSRTGSIKAWRKGQPIPQELMDVAANPEKYNFIAWNVMFDYLIWDCVLAKLMPFYKRPPLEQIIDGMAASTEFRTGASLESAAKMMGFPTTKDQDGRRLMLKQCKPNAKGEWVELTPEEWITFERYGLQDTRLLRDIYYRLPPMSEREQWAFSWTLKRNLRGLNLDVELIKELDSIVKENLPKLIAEFDYCVGYKCKMNSPVKLKEFFQEYYPWIQNMGADTVRDMLASTTPVPPQIRRALEIKDMAGSTSIAKIPTALAQMYQGRIYGILAYNYTQTKRWAGRGIQVQNFPRPDDSLMDPIDFELNVGDLVSVVRERRKDLRDPIGFVKNLLRRMFLPSAGNLFYCGDFSKVEPSVLFWLTGMGPIPQKWYEEMAAEIFSMDLKDVGKDSFERQVAKAANLSCSYGTGWKGFRDSQAKAGLILTDDMCKQVVHAYRQKNKAVVDMWKDLEVGFRKAIYGEATKLCDGKVFIMPMPKPWKGVMIRLPSGSNLYYHQAQQSTEEYMEETVINTIVDGRTISRIESVKKVRTVMKYLADQGQGRIGWDYVYGGLLCENVVSATARDILVPAMWRLEQAGFDVLNVVHDEIWADAAAGREEEFNKVMCVNPSWCDMDISSDLKCGVRYLK